MIVCSIDRWQARLFGGLALCMLGILQPAASSTAAERGHALVIGNARYPQAPLNNPENDARLIASTLKRLGFEVTEHENLGVMDFRRVLRDYVRRLQDENGAALFYYAGHAVQIDGRNYLLPVDIDLRDEDEVRDDAVEIDEQLVRRIEHSRARVRILILDACRDDPYVSSRAGRGVSRAGGLAEMSASGALIAYSSAPGQAAQDGPPGSDSIYTRSLAREMLAENVQIEKMFKNVLVDVLRDTNERQVPWVNSSLTVDFSFNPAHRTVVDISPAHDQPMALAALAAPGRSGATQPPDDALKPAVAGLVEQAGSRLPPVPGQGEAPASLVVDPLIDASTGFHTGATRLVEQRVLAVLRERLPRLQAVDFTAENVARRPLVLVGTVTPLARDRASGASGPAYATRLALLDLQRGIVLSTASARTRLDGADATPTRFYGDMPAWAPDASVGAYARACNEATAGAPIDPAYRDGIAVSAAVNTAVEAYEGGRLREALDAFKSARRQGADPQLRIESGLYLSATGLDRISDAQQAFARIVDLGLAGGRLGVRFNFRPGSAQFIDDAQARPAYALWLALVAQRAETHRGCLEISGHAGRDGDDPASARLSLLRAQSIKERIDALDPQIAARTLAVGRGLHESLSGPGSDDARDAIDQRVEFKVLDCHRDPPAAAIRTLVQR